ncbi:MAG TPA: carboxypeptidase-like regulatory domain-containing protein, partial [Pyrinomonadaceae bacterium]|nr:carboxypeptidase-like regulatory domain-containing protein [Pyrinomonadaceae bacterium]
MKKIINGIIFIFLSLALVGAAQAQRPGSITGQVQDALGAVVVGASITVVGQNGSTKTAVSNQRGEFSINGLAPGKYTVKVKADKF